MKTYYWQCVKSDGCIIEGKFNILHRLALRLMGAKFTRVGEWQE